MPPNSQEVPALTHTQKNSTLAHLLLPRLSRSIIPASSKLTHPPSPPPNVAHPNRRSHGWRWPCHLPRTQLDGTLESSLLATPNSISRDPRPTHFCPCQPPHPHLSLRPLSGWRRRLLHGRPTQPSAELKRQFQSRDHTEHNTDLGTESQLLIRPRRPLSLPSSVSAWLQPPWPPLPFPRLAPVSWPVHPFLSAQRACPRCPHLSPSQLLLSSHLSAPIPSRRASLHHPAPVLPQLQLQSTRVCCLLAVRPASLNPSFLSL